MPDTGWLSPGTVAEIEDGSVAWSDLANASAEDGSNASNALGIGDLSHSLYCSNYNANLPVGATVNGVEVRIKRAYDSGSSSDPTQDTTLLLTPGGSKDGDDKAVATAWPADTVAFSATYGGAADVWSLALTRTIVNASDFGAALQAACNNGLGNTVALVDVIQIKVTYTEAAAGQPTMRRFGGVPGMGQGQKIGRSW